MTSNGSWRVLVWFAAGAGYVVKSSWLPYEEAKTAARGYDDANATRIDNPTGSWEQIKGNSNRYP